jgi:hypothetical protein
MGETISQTEFDSWVTPNDVMSRLVSLRWSVATICDVLLYRLRAGLVQSAAATAWFQRETQADERPVLRRLEPGLFAKIGLVNEPSFWHAGDLRFGHDVAWSVLSKHRAAFFGIRLDPSGLADILPTPATHSTPSAPAGVEQQSGARRGAKRKDWWDHLWLEMFRRMEAGRLNPATQAELQEILESYTMHELGENYGDSTLKPMARNLFKFLEERRGKIAGE